MYTRVITVLSIRHPRPVFTSCPSQILVHHPLPHPHHPIDVKIKKVNITTPPNSHPLIDVKNKKGIYHPNSLSPLNYDIALTPIQLFEIVCFPTDAPAGPSNLKMWKIITKYNLNSDSCEK